MFAFSSYARFLAALAVVGAPALAACGDDQPPPLPRTVAEDPVDLPLTGASATERELFSRGDALFDLSFRQADGLGPLYIRTACSACHAEAGRGPGLVEKMAGGASTAALPYGATIRPFAVAGASTPLVPPGAGDIDWDGQPLTRSVRVGPALWGRGYLEAIADSEIERMQEEQASRGDAIHGRINRVTYHSEGTTDAAFGGAAPAGVQGASQLVGRFGLLGRFGRLGRFGLKARVATIDDFSADALQGDMGLTSPLRPVELPNPDGITDDRKPGLDVSLETVADLANYIRLIEIPGRAPQDAAARALFDGTLCAVCHVPALHTRADYPLPLLADIDAPVYSDLLLHDMGEALADGVADESASGREWRTPPLIGLRFFRSYLHDGRARSIDEAVRLHAGPGSQANEAVARYESLSDEQRNILLRFVTSL